MSTRKYVGEDLVFALDLDPNTTGLTDVVAEVTDITGAAIATVNLTEAQPGSYRGVHTTTQAGVHHVLISSASQGVDEIGVYDVRPASESPAAIAADIAAVAAAGGVTTATASFA